MEKAEQVGADLGVIAGILAPFDGVAGEFSGVGGGQLTVDHDTVLQVGKVIHDQWQQLTDVTQPKLFALRIANIGDDHVSQAATKAWNDLLTNNDDSYASRIQQYIDGLKKLSDQLRAAAQQYGYTEEQITGAFGAPE